MCTYEAALLVHTYVNGHNNEVGLDSVCDSQDAGSEGQWIYKMCCLNHINGSVVVRGSAARINRDNCGVSADHVV